MAHKIIKIHGCSGAGKTTAVRLLLNDAVFRTVLMTPKDKIEAYLLECVVGNVVVLGSYQNNCGGMDTVSKASDAMDMVKKYQRVGHVVHEGLLQSTYYGAMGKDSVQYGDNYVYAFLDTPLELCLERVVARRAANESKNKFDPQLTTDKHRTIERLKAKLPAMGHRVVTLRHDDDMLGQLYTILGAAS